MKSPADIASRIHTSFLFHIDIYFPLLIPKGISENITKNNIKNGMIDKPNKTYGEKNWNTKANKMKICQSKIQVIPLNEVIPFFLESEAMSLNTR